MGKNIYINQHELDGRIKSFMARREKRNPGLIGTSVRAPRPIQWRNLINDTTKRDVLKNIKRVKAR